MTRAIMIQGTMSNAGKSLLTAGLCRIFRQDGYRVAPFKSQNMALNSFITDRGLEMGRAQVVQAEAADTEPDCDMNPILLKPSSDTGSQVIVNGIPVGTMPAREYFAYKKTLIPVIQKAYERLCRKYDIIVIEGAGSPAEINLKADDIVNMGMAKMAGAPVLLAGDIDRGGVFAQLYGTVMLLEPDERQMVKGLIVNKFRGDGSILEPGVRMLEKLCGIPSVGVVPYMDIDLEEEDSLSTRLQGGMERTDSALSRADIAVIRFPRLSNYTDFHVLEKDGRACVRYVSRLSELGKPDLIILPGTKNTVEDMLWMRQNGLESAIKKKAAAGLPVWGICGGYQMMGEKLLDRDGTEGGKAGFCIAGMGLFPNVTVFRSEKTRTQVTGVFGRVSGIFSALSGKKVSGYEIHMGETCSEGDSGAKDISVYSRGESRYFLELREKQLSGNGRKTDGICSGNLYGTYVHGIFDEPGIASGVIEALLAGKGIAAETSGECGRDYRAYRESQYDRLAGILRESLDMPHIYEILNQGL